MMRIVAILLLGVALFSARSVAQDDGMGRFGAQLTDLTKEEADALGWEAPRGVKVVKPVAGG